MRLFDLILDVIFPPSRREKAVQELTVEDFFVHPHTFALNDTNITSLLSYKDKNVQNLIRTLKYSGSFTAASLCAKILEDFLTEEIAELETLSDKSVIITSVPLGKKRKQERGFNQTALILKELHKMLPHIEISDEILIRTKETKPQTTLSRKERLENVANAFELTKRGKALPKNTFVILIDDVTTVGATLYFASRPLTENGIQVLPLAIAHG